MGKCACQTRTTAKTDTPKKRCGCNSKQPLLASNPAAAMQAAGQLADICRIAPEEQEHLHQVVRVDELPNATYLIRIEKKGLEPRSGQYMALSVPGDIQTRHYSIYSGENDETLDFLIKEVDDGIVSVKLHQFKPGDKVLVEGPWGHFRVRPSDVGTKRFLFVASGTGISPFHSFIKSYPGLDYQLLHGVRYGNDRYGMDEYPKKRYVACTSRDGEGDFRGRVTDYLKANRVEPGTLCYLCGNNQMIEDAIAILQSQGIKESEIYTEIFF
ncbi:FAD-binding oxidoreductase [uncultured Acetobacteroides sp.]|uniref:ferredoxin--NADP reductase n=1 Tax=uncultured Acetobacteroides sp. TaxID=1760811 RepID=UPI0029F5BEA5|nr:FAD-binding oxidoreductase [uncultured Acetobacteroides sp.]